jgi:hypothetical protein
MKIGAEPKKIGALAGLLLVAAIVYYVNIGSDSGAPSAPRRSAAADPVANVSAPVDTSAPAKRRDATGRATVKEFMPTRPKSVNATKTDPTLRLDLLAKVQSINPEGGSRNIFTIGMPPPVPQPKEPIPVVPPIKVANQAPATPPVPPPPPPPPPINLKYYGFSTKRSDGEKKAFFLDGDDIIVAAEGEIMKKRYKVVKIGVNSVQVEDTVSKSTQTLPLQQDATTPA